MKKYINPTKTNWSELTTRPAVEAADLSALVKQVFNEVKLNGDKAIKSYTNQFDKVNLSSLCVSAAEFTVAEKQVSDELKEAIKLASSNIEKFHNIQKQEKQVVETTNGVFCWQESRPIERVGLYIPGGTAPLFSTVLMLAIPAKIAGCKKVVLCTPPNKEGKIANEILYVAKLVGITEVYKVGGIQAIAALTYGSESIPKVYKIFGPGNQYVTAAKQEAFQQGVAIDMPAGPSELLVVADESSNAAFVASDLLSQAEHGTDSQVICIANNEVLIKAIEKEVEAQLEQLPRKEIARKALTNSKLVVLESVKDTIDFVNEYAPEHLILAVKNEDEYIQNIINAGSVFIGNYTPESAGDYASGTNHTLPTNGFSKSFSGVNLDAFVKKITFQKITKEGILNIGKSIELMAEAELLQAHKNAVTVRVKSLKVES
ncbi:MAG: histidinol dehydrogenase [Flavobacteriales bacterium]|nr:histidinol dehydrogenase [Flavobacteriales bacterium]MCB9173963.1 histidinol dehydrogenase [Flavobacteriales bacterium]